MKKITIGAFFVLFAAMAGLAASPAALADHSEVTVVPAQGSGVAGCETTPEGCFIPSTVTVDVGGVVIFSNTDTVAHTFTGGTARDGPSGVFDSSLVMAGASYEFKTEEVGEVQYFCIVHPWMEGLIVVQADDDGADGMDDHGGKSGADPGDPAVQGMLSDGTVVSVWTGEPAAGEQLQVTIKFADSDHVNYDVVVTQNGEDVLRDEGGHEHEGVATMSTAPLSTSDPVDISIVFQGYGVNDLAGPIGEELAFTSVMPGDDVAVVTNSDPTVQGMLSDGTVVSVWTGEPAAGEQLQIIILHVDEGHPNYGVTVSQNGMEVLRETAHSHGLETFKTAPLSTGDPVDISIVFRGHGYDPDATGIESHPHDPIDITGPVDEELIFTNVVPEFGAIAMVVLAVAIVSIIAITAKSRVIPRL